VDRGVVPVQPPVLRRHYWSLLPENFQESGQSSPDVGGVDRFALRHEICIDNALRIKENEDHLLHPRSVHLCLQRAWLALLHPLFGLPLGFRGVEGNSGLVHGDYIVESRQGMLPEELKEVLTPLDSLIFLRRGEEFWDPASGLLYEAKIDGEGRLDRRKSMVQHVGQLSNCQAPVLLNGGGDSGHNVLSPLVYFLCSSSADQRLISPPSQLLLCGLSGF
jgi:hypothetical protein